MRFALPGLLVIASWCVAASPPARAQAAGIEPLLHPLFQDHAVLQRDVPLRVWGQARAGEAVSVSFARQTVTTRADAEGRWSARLRPLAAGGPYELVARAGQVTQRVRDVQLGDVWLCSGQSNMELPVWRALDANSEIASGAYPRIRLFNVPQSAAVVPQLSFQGRAAWNPASPETVRDFSAACLYFARELQKTVDVPMGLIQAAWGGSRIEAWIGASALRAGGGRDEALDVLVTYADDPAAALAQWGRQWERWWTTRPHAVPGDMPWQPGASAGDWHDAPASLGAWERWNVAALADYNGMVWYRTQVTLTAAQAVASATLELAPADETDMTWVNGVAAGSRYGAGEPRRYPLPAGLLKPGINTVVVNVLDTYRDGGLAGPADAQALRFSDGTRVVLDTPWQYRMAPSDTSPPGAPWQAATGLSTLYNGMIAPLHDYGVRGVLWYQGESNTGEAAAYAPLLRLLRDDWRRRFGPQTPFLVVQLAGYGMPPSSPVQSGWAELRDAQRQVAAEDAQCGLAVAIDIGDAYDIHPPNKQELGRRLARLARHVVYGERTLAPSGPVARAVSRTPDGVGIAFDGITGTLATTGSDHPIGFELCDATQRCRYVDARIEASRVVVRGPAVAGAIRVRYCWADGPVCTLRDTAGLPAGPFELPIPAVEAPR